MQILALASSSARRLVAAALSDRPLKLLITIAVIVPIVLLGVVASRERAATLDEARATAEKTVTALSEHAGVALDSARALLDETDERVANRGWDAIANDRRLHRWLAERVRSLSPIASVDLIDARGRLRQSSLAPAEADASYAGHDFFHAVQAMAPGAVYVSKPYEGRGTGDRQFALAIRRTTADGAFDGAIVVALPLDYFSTFWGRFAPSTAHIIPLARDDGELLIRYPLAKNPERLDPDGPFLGRARVEPRGFYTALSHVDGIERMNAYARIKDYPLYIAFSIESRAVLAQWGDRLQVNAVLTVLFSLALAALTMTLASKMREHRDAAHQWQQLAQRHEAEIARRREAEAKLVQAQKMEIVGQLTGGVAHDFNNLLQAMLTNVHLAKIDVGDRPSARYLQEVRHGIDRAAKLTQQLMSFSRRQTLAPQPLDLSQFAAGISELLKHTLGAAVSIDFRLPDDVWSPHVDRNQMEMSLLNLVINARDAMPDGGTVTVSARNATVGNDGGELAPGDYVVVTVADDGVGMTPEVLKRVFEPFYTTKDVGKGSGLGLSMVYGFARQSGGTVTVDSEPGVGTTVALHLPRSHAPAKGPVASAPAAAPVASRGSRVLLVDDDALVRASTAASLQTSGYNVLQAADGDEAIDRLRREHVDVVVTDFAMPGMKGTEVARRARLIRPDVPVLMITGYAQTAKAAPDLLRHVDRIVQKPFAPEALVAQIESLLVPAG